MALKCREDIVGKRFLCVFSLNKGKSKKINDWIWRQGVIRASNRSNLSFNDLTVMDIYNLLKHNSQSSLYSFFNY